MEQWARCMYPYTITLSFAWIVMLGAPTFRTGLGESGSLLLG